MRKGKGEVRKRRGQDIDVRDPFLISHFTFL
jgi:hypothetical protein